MPLNFIHDQYFIAASDLRKRITSNRKMQPQRTMSMNTESVIIEANSNPIIGKSAAASVTSSSSAAASTKGAVRPPPPRDLNRGLTCQSIDINVIQPTPNISPSASLRSIDDGLAGDKPASSEEATPKTPTGAAVASTTSGSVEAAAASGNGSSPSSAAAIKSKRRVSFSEDEASTTSGINVLEQEAAATASKGSTNSSRRGSLATSLRQMTVPMAANISMSYLQVR